MAAVALTQDRCGVLCELIRLLNMGPFCQLLQNPLISNDFSSSCMLPISTHCLQTDADDHTRMIFFLK